MSDPTTAGAILSPNALHASFFRANATFSHSPARMEECPNCMRLPRNHPNGLVERWQIAL
jgi:hypothetical protein